MGVMVNGEPCSCDGIMVTLGSCDGVVVSSALVMG